MPRKQEATPCSVIKAVAAELKCSELSAFKLVCDNADILEHGIRLGSFTGYVANEIIRPFRAKHPFATAGSIFDYALTTWVPLVRSAGFGGMATGMEMEIKRLKRNINRSGTYPSEDLFNYMEEHVLSFLHSSRGGEDVYEALLEDLRRLDERFRR